MTPLYQWAARHRIPPAAMTDLLYTLGVTAPAEPAPVQCSSEAAVQQQVRLRVAQAGGRVFRNNVGVAADSATGRPVRYGLCNDSHQMNRVCKSSDLIGITPVTCACGHRYGVFTALECKAPTWVFRQSDDRAVAQLNFIKLVISLGGIGRFVTDPQDI